LAIFVDWTELADETHDGVRCPRRVAKHRQRQNDQRRPDVRLPSSFTEGDGRFAERHSAIARHDQTSHFSGRADNETKNGSVAISQNGDGQNETEKQEINVVETIG
jgi:hypothetical protein